MTTRQELRVYLITAIIASACGGLTAFLVTRLTMPTNPTTLTLEGEAEAGINGVPRIVHYKSPFASPPHLTFPNGQFGYEITSETAESFTVRRTAFGEGINEMLKWKAEGQPVRKDTDARSGGKG